MEKYKGCWSDNNFNMWNRTEYTEHEAERLSRTLINCKNCVDSEYLVNCYGCKDCRYSIDLINCISCTESAGCKDSYDLHSCSMCTSCQSCSECTWCHECHGCKGGDGLQKIKGGSGVTMDSIKIAKIMGVRHSTLLIKIRKLFPGVSQRLRVARDGKLQPVYDLTRTELFVTITGDKGKPFADLILPDPEIYDYAYKNCDDYTLKNEITCLKRDKNRQMFKSFKTLTSVEIADIMYVDHHNLLQAIRRELPGAKQYKRKAKDGKLHPHYIFRTRRELFTLLTGRKGAKFANILLPNPEIYKYAVSPIRHRIFELNEQRKTQLWQNRNHNLDVDVESTKQELKKMEDLLNEVLLHIREE